MITLCCMSITPTPWPLPASFPASTGALIRRKALSSRYREAGGTTGKTQITAAPAPGPPASLQQGYAAQRWQLQPPGKMDRPDHSTHDKKRQGNQRQMPTAHHVQCPGPAASAVAADAKQNGTHRTTPRPAHKPRNRVNRQYPASSGTKVVEAEPATSAGRGLPPLGDRTKFRIRRRIESGQERATSKR